MGLLTPPNTVTGCAYKGFTEYWSVEAVGQTFKDLACSYKTPLAENVKIAGLVAFYNERADLICGRRTPGAIKRPSSRDDFNAPFRLERERLAAAVSRRRPDRIGQRFLVRPRASASWRSRLS